MSNRNETLALHAGKHPDPANDVFERRAPVIIRKYGGEALASPARIRAAAEQIVERAAQIPLVVVASARRGVTDHLLELLREVGGARASRSADRVVASGEIVSAGLLAAAIQQLGRKAVALDGREAGLRASGDWGSATLRRVQPRRIRQILTAGAIPVVAGFQARRRRGLATLGRGGSDLTAVALAAALGGECELVKDVGAIYTADPHLCPAALPFAEVSYRFLDELSRAGARVCHPRAAALASRSDVPIRFVHFADDGPSTLVRRDANDRCTAVVLCREIAERAAAADAGATPSDMTDAALDAISVVGLPDDDWPSRLQAAEASAGAAPVQVTVLGRRLLLAVKPDESLGLLQALHREFVERRADTLELRCSA